MSKGKSIKRVKTVFFYLITFYLLAYIGINLLIPEKAIHIFGFQITSISRLTESMKPTILPGDVIVLKTIDENDIDQGDIISFYTYVQGFDNNQNLVWVKIKVVHRVIGIDESNQGFLTQGDNNAEEDIIRNEDGDVIPLTYDSIIGEYAFRVPVLGTIVTGLRNPILLGLVAVNITIVIVLIKYIAKKDQAKPKIKGDYE